MMCVGLCLIKINNFYFGHFQCGEYLLKREPNIANLGVNKFAT
jgi:hypothetical protein